MMISIGLFVSHSDIRLLFPPLEFAAVTFSSSASSAEDSSEIVTPSATAVALLNVMLSVMNAVSLDMYHIASMLSMENITWRLKEMVTSLTNLDKHGHITPKHNFE